MVLLGAQNAAWLIFYFRDLVHRLRWLLNLNVNGSNALLLVLAKRLKYVDAIRALCVLNGYAKVRVLRNPISRGYLGELFRLQSYQVQQFVLRALHRRGDIVKGQRTETDALETLLHVSQ